jgi:nucleotide-binding universal stress UspA family protein
MPAATTQVVRGAAEEVILESAGQHSATLIAMATHGRSGVKRWLLGSVAEKVLRATANPLFLVRADVARREPLRIINALVVPLDGSTLAESILPTVSAWAKALDLEVTLVRAFEPLSAAQFGSETYLPNLEEIEADARREITQYLRDQERALVGAGVRTVETEILEGPAADEIIKYAHEAPRAVIAMSTHGRTGARRWILGSVTEKVVRHGDDPVLVIRCG